MGGFERAIVRDAKDPRQLGRIKVRIPTLTGPNVTGWIWPIIESGYVVVPRPGDQVWVSFESDNRDNPVWVGHARTSTDYTSQYGKKCGDISRIPDRVQELEDEVAELKRRVSLLETGKADVSHGHVGY